MRKTPPFWFIISIIILSIAFISPARSASDKEKMRIAVLDFKADGVAETKAGNIAELLRIELVNSGSFTVIERTQMDQILKEQEFSQTGCVDKACAVKVGRLLSANKMLAGRVMMFGEELTITASIIDVEKGSIEYADKVTIKSDEDIHRAIQSLAKNLSLRNTGKSAKSEPEKIATPQKKDDKPKVEAAKVKPKEAEPRKADPTDYEGSRHSGIMFFGTYSMPFGSMGNTLKPLAGIGLLGELQVIRFDSVLLYGIAGGGYSYHNVKTSKSSNDSLGILTGWAGFGTGYNLSSDFSLHFSLLAGYSRSSLTQSENSTSYTSNDPAIMGMAALRYQLTPELFLSVNTAYSRVLYIGSDLTELQFGAGIGYGF